jgi:hypothetical protein
MLVITKLDIVTHKILNENTGELEEKSFKEEFTRKQVKGGFNMIYHKAYEEVTEEVIKSNQDLKLFNWVTNKFTYAQVEVMLTHPTCPLKISQPKFSKFIKALVEMQYLLRVSRGLYRLNPFIYLPYRAEAETLQMEWNELIKRQPRARLVQFSKIERLNAES